MLFDSSMYRGERLVKDVFYYLSRFRVNKLSSALTFNPVMTGNLEALKGGIIAYLSS